MTLIPFSLAFFKAGLHASGSIGTTHRASMFCSIKLSITCICSAESVIEGPFTKQFSPDSFANSSTPICILKNQGSDISFTTTAIVWLSFVFTPPLLPEFASCFLPHPNNNVINNDATKSTDNTFFFMNILLLIIILYVTSILLSRI